MKAITTIWRGCANGRSKKGLTSERVATRSDRSARFGVLDERSASELMGQARTAVLERAAKGDARLKSAVALLATRAADGRFAEILDFAIRDAAKLREMLSRHDGDELRFAAHLRKGLDLAEDEDEAKVLTRFCAELGGERSMCERVARRL